MDLRLFFSWQTDTDSPKLRHTTFIKECIHIAIKQAEKELGNIKIEYQEGVKNIPGSKDIIPEIEDRIEKCHIFVADLTLINHGNPVFRIINKLFGKPLKVTPNPNVINERARFCGRKGMESQCFSVLNEAFGNPNNNVELMPVDLRGKRFPVSFKLERYNGDVKDADYEDTKRKFISGLTEAIVDCAKQARTHLDEDIKPFKSWQKHQKTSGFEGRYIRDGLEDYLANIRENKDNLRICGLSGLGKTRMVLEAFRGEDTDYLYAYVDCQLYNECEIMDKINFMFEHYKEMTLVFDNCELMLHDQIIRTKRASRGTNPIITIFNDPEERTNNLSKPLNLQQDFNDIVDKILERFHSFYKEEDKEKLKEFAGGIPMIAQLLGEGLRSGGPLGVISDGALMDKILGVDKNSTERTIMRSISLFDFIGFNDELHKELEFIAKEKSITSLSMDEQVLLQEFDKVILKYLRRKIIERKGRLVGIRPTPIALYLIGEWIEECTDARLLNVIRSIQSSEVASELSSSFAEQFRYMGHNEKARMMLNELLGPNSPFCNAEVINTKLGSRLFRSFAEVNPAAVSNCLWNALGTSSTDELMKIRIGRRNLVWTLEKLCFDHRSFDKSARLMMMLGIAENEDIANNARNQFKTLFPIYLPSTEVSLVDRLQFLQDVIRVKEYKEIVLEAIGCALSTHDFIRMRGAEIQGTNTLKSYQPTTRKEISEYLEGNLQMIVKELKNTINYREQCLKILSSNFLQLCHFGYIKLVLPYIIDVCKYVNYDWPNMLDALYSTERFKNICLDEENKKQIASLIDLLTKKDFISRFRSVAKQYERNCWQISYENQLKINEKEYEKLAEEAVADAKYDIATLQQIFSSDYDYCHPFGQKMIELLDSNDRLLLLDNCIEALQTPSKLGESVIEDASRALSNEEFKHLFDRLEKAKLFDLLFASCALRFEGEYSQQWLRLIDLVKKGIAPLTSFNQYWIRLPISKLTDDIVYVFFKDILSFSNSLSVVLHMSMFLTYGSEGKVMPKTFALLTQAILEDINMPQTDDYWHVVHRLLLPKHNIELAKSIHTKVVKYYDSSKSFNACYGVEKFYDIMVEHYFDELWPDMSHTLINDRYSGFILQDILSSMIEQPGNDNNKLFQEKHNDTLLKWCDDYPQKAPSVLIRMIPLGSGTTFPNLVLQILDKFGMQHEVLSALSCNLGSFAWMGSIIPFYETQRKRVLSLQSHYLSEVRKWASDMVSYYDKAIEVESNKEAEGFR